MLSSCEILWQSVLAPFLEQGRPGGILMVGSGRDLAGKMLDLAAAWNGNLHLAAAADECADLVGQGADRFTLHRASGRDAAGILPVPDVAVVEGGLDWQAATGLLHALDKQARRTHRSYPVMLFAGFAGRVPGQEGSPGQDDPRAGVVGALEDFVSGQAPKLVFSVLPLLDGFAVLAPRDTMARHDIRGLLEAIAMGHGARLMAEHAETGRMALTAAQASLDAQLASERYRNGKLHAALRQAQVAARELREAEAPSSGRPMTIARAAAGLRRRLGAAQSGSGQPNALTPLAMTELGRLRESAIFDAAWYRQTYADIAESELDAAEHYYRYGAEEGRDPGPYFVTAFYLASNTAVSQNPVLHYLDVGARERLDPGPDFDTGYYLDANPDVAESGLNPLEHYLAQGMAEGRQAHPSR